MAVSTSLFFVLFVLPLSWAQFPAVCNTEDNLSTKTCCPDNCGSHGTCVSVREEVERSWELANQTYVGMLHGMPGWPQDVRYQWPLKIFEMVCSCDEGWGSYDCSQCDFGYIANEADECVKMNTNQLLVRRNFMDISEQERFDLIRLMNISKNGDKHWAIISSVPEETGGYYHLQNVSFFDMMTFTHFLTAREKQSSYCPTLPNAPEGPEYILFAHQHSPFLPWHRYFLLQYESELRRIADGIGVKFFVMPYWDWTPVSSCLIFRYELFGTPEYHEEVLNVSGKLFENGNWPAVCDLRYRVKKALNISASECAKVKTLCDVEEDRKINRPLQRGAWRDEIRGIQLPDFKLMSMLLGQDKFGGTYGFGNRLEGHLEQCAGESVKCMYYIGGGLNNHGIVHELVGGHMSIGGTSANDPVFYPHHSNTDRVFERWLQKYNGTPPTYTPVSGGPPGHNLDDYLVPMFPLRKVADFYKESKELGFVYDDLPWGISTTDYQFGCPSAQCDKGGYPPTVLVNSTSAYCTKLRMSLKLTGGA